MISEDDVPVGSLVGGVVGLRVGAADGAPVVGDDGGGSVESAEGRPRESVEVDVSPRSAVGAARSPEVGVAKAVDRRSQALDALAQVI